MTTISIIVGTQPAGYTFELEPHSRELVNREEAPPDTPRPASFSIPFELQQDFCTMHGRDELLWMIAGELTSLPREDIRQIASKVQLLNPAREFALIHTVTC